jgi:glutathione peroxidase
MNFHSFKWKDTSGGIVDFRELAGKKVLVVNSASACGFTPQFSQLEELYRRFGGEKFEIICFPSNDFGAQDPGSNSEIASFCKVNYGVTFPVMAKVRIVGEEANPIYKWLQKGSNAIVKWNFHKFLIDESGELVKELASSVLPIDEEIVSWVEGNKL